MLEPPLQNNWSRGLESNTNWWRFCLNQKEAVTRDGGTKGWLKSKVSNTAWGFIYAISAHIGQTRRCLKTRLTEHRRNVKNNTLQLELVWQRTVALFGMNWPCSVQKDNATRLIKSCPKEREDPVYLGSDGTIKSSSCAWDLVVSSFGTLSQVSFWFPFDHECWPAGR